MLAELWDQIYRFSTLPLICLLLSCCLGLRYWHRLPHSLQWLVVYLVFNFLIEIGARTAAALFRQNLPLLHVYTAGEFVLFSLFYRQILDEQSVFKTYFNWILPVGLLLVVLNTVFLQGIFEFNSYAKSLVQIVIILYALDYAFRIAEPEGDTRVLRLINAAILIYYCGSLFIFMASQFESVAREPFRLLWTVNKVLNLIFQLLILTALWKAVFNHPGSSSSPARAS